MDSAPSTSVDTQTEMGGLLARQTTRTTGSANPRSRHIFPVPIMAIDYAMIGETDILAWRYLRSLRFSRISQVSRGLSKDRRRDVLGDPVDDPPEASNDFSP